jgi:hypothetical protein
VTDLPYDDAPESDAWSIDPDLPDDEVGVAIMGFLMLVRLGPEDAGLARLGVEAIVRALGDASGPDTPTPGMMGIPALIEDGLARAALADASPSAREVLGDLERALVGLGPSAAPRSARPTTGSPAAHRQTTRTDHLDHTHQNDRSTVHNVAC